MKKACIVAIMLNLCCFPSAAFARDGLRLAAAYMCEQVSDAGPENRAIVFSAADGKVFCFCYFESVPEKATVFHVWYHGDRVVTRRKLTLEPPSWKIFSTMQLRETDKGPWRVEILGSDNKLLDTVRFSVTD
jgi:hypothetical protein